MLPIDINFKQENITFNFRVAALIRRGEEILVEKNKQVDYYSLPGGRCHLGEDSINALKREIKEEMGAKTDYIRSIGLIENFFTSRYSNSPYHEILIIHELKFLNKDMYEQKEIINAEEPSDAKFMWREIGKLDKCQPQILFDHLNDPNFFYYINKDKDLSE